jgi:hypothetical protein
MPHRRLLTWVAALLVTIAGPLLAASDPSTPKGALRGFYEAMEAGDAAGVRASFYTTTDAEKQLADAYAAQLTAAKALGEAAKAKFASAGDALSKGLPVRDEIARLDAADVKVDGNRATVRLAGLARPLTMVQSEGRWRLALADYAGATAPESLAGQTAVLNDMAGVFQSVADDINGEKFATATDAQRALQKKLQGVLFTALQKNPPTTQPATATSATRPSLPPARN